jgi:hypothetical protein
MQQEFQYVNMTNRTWRTWTDPHLKSKVFHWKCRSGGGCFLFKICGKVSAPMTERGPHTAQPPHKINYENSQRNFGYVEHPLVKCDTTFKFALFAVKGSLSFWGSTCVCLDSICDSFHKSKYILFLIFSRRIPTSQLTILQNLKQFKLVNLYLQGFED